MPAADGDAPRRVCVGSCWRRGCCLVGPVAKLHAAALSAHLEAALQGVTQVLCDLVNPDAAHGPDCKCPDQWVGILRVLQEQNRDCQHNPMAN